MIGSLPGPWSFGSEIKLSAEESKVSWKDNSIQEVLRKVEFSGLTSACGSQIQVTARAMGVCPGAMICGPNSHYSPKANNVVSTRLRAKNSSPGPYDNAGV